MAERERILWSIGTSERLGDELVDNYAQPLLADAVVWRVGQDGPAATAHARRWPIFQPSEADPDAGYRLHPYTILFPLDSLPESDALLQIGFLAIGPRLGWLELRLNGHAGRLYLRPQAASVARVELRAGLQTGVYAEGQTDVWLPRELLSAGENRLELICRDEGETIHVAHPEAVKRLDRMASAAGVGYRWLRFVLPERSPGRVLARAEFHPTVVYRRDQAGRLNERCDLTLEVARPLAAATAHLRLAWQGGSQEQELALPAVEFGHLRLPIDLPDGDGAVEWRLRAELDGEVVAAEGAVNRRPKWLVHVAPHLHTDVGYTHRQPEVAERLCRAIDAAVELGERQPDAFAFHLDSAWSLEHYLATRDEARLQRLGDGLRSGRLGVSGTWVDLLTQFAGLEDLIRNREFAEGLLRRLGATTDFVTVVDVPSISGSLPALLSESGIGYLAHASNQDRGPFRLNGALHLRSPFRWSGTAGGSVLTWLSKAYCELRKVCGSPPTLDSAEKGLELWLSELEAGGAGVAIGGGGERLALLYGQEADNTDIDPQPAAFVEAWNRGRAYPRLLPGTPGAFFRAVEEAGASALAQMAGDGGAYWEDGVGSSLAETIAVREAQASLPAAERLEALAALHGVGRAYPQGDFDAAWREVLQYDEHTWGAFLSVTDPDALLARDQWLVKRQFAEHALRSARWLLHGAASRHSLSWNNEGREVAVYNPHSWPLSGSVEIEIGPSEVPVDPRTGRPVRLRRLRQTATQAIVELWIDALDGLSYRRLPLLNDAPDVGRAPPERRLSRAAGSGQVVLESDRYALTLDPARGCAISWIDRSLGRELVDVSDGWGLGRLLYAIGGEGTRLAANVERLPAVGPRIVDDFRLREAHVERFDHGSCAIIRGEIGCGEVELSWTLYREAPEIELRFALDKQERPAMEALYVAFPLDLPDAHVRSDSQLGWVDWSDDRLPGACSEWLPLQSVIWAAGTDAHVLVASPDVPLFCLGEVVGGRWASNVPLTGGRLLSYVLNNYWHTNYRASQGGALRFGYRLTSSADIDPVAAYRFGWSARRPLYGQRLSFQAFRTLTAPYADPDGATLARITPPEVVLTTIKPSAAEDAWLLRLQEVGGADRLARMEFGGLPIRRAWAVDLVDRPRHELPLEGDGSLRVPISAWGLASVRLVVDSRPATASTRAPAFASTTRRP